MSGMMGTRTIVQVALVVRDVEAKAKAWAEVLGVEPPEPSETGPQSETGAVYRGEPTEGRAKIAFFDTGPFRLEIIEPTGGPSTWREFLDAHGEGVHHVAFQVESMDEIIARFDAAGMPPAQRGNFHGGRYGYIDSQDKLGVVLELLEEF